MNERPDESLQLSANEHDRRFKIFRKQAVIDAIEAWERQKAKGYNAPTYEVKARIRSLFEDCRSTMSRTEDEDTLEAYSALLESGKMEDLLEVFRFISAWLDENQITTVGKPKVVY